MIKLDIKRKDGVELPLYKSELASGFDLKVNSFKKLFKGTKEVLLSDTMQTSIKDGYLTLRGFERLLVGTGIYVEIPQGYELQVRDKAGNALKRGILVANAPGTVDADYKGEIGIILINNTPFLNRIEIGEVVAQGVIGKALHALWNPVEELTYLHRGEPTEE